MPRTSISRGSRRAAEEPDEADHNDDNADNSDSAEAPLLHNQPIDTVEHARAEGQPEFTLRAVLVGLGIGTLICVSNCYFGLQTGWISMMSLPASLMAFGIFKLLGGLLERPFGPVENVLVQTVAVASGTMPLAAGLVGVVPALQRLLTPEEGGPVHLSLGRLIVWSGGVAFFGVYFAVPLRKQVLIREKLKFPSGTATAEMITVLHRHTTSKPPTDVSSTQRRELSYAAKVRALGLAFAASAAVTILIFFFPSARRLAIFDWLTLGRFNLKRDWLISFQPSLAYVGQGMIMGPNTTLSMLFGAVIGWGLLAPLAKQHGWAPGPVGDYNTGARGWLIWVSLAIMLTDSIVSLLVVTTRWILTQSRADHGHDEPEEYEAPPSALVPARWTWLGLGLSSILCIGAIAFVFDNKIPIYAIVVSIVLALFLSVLGVRALGETDLNPVSGIGKISQLLFALIIKQGSPNAILINLVAGGVAEAGAQQAGDLMQDLKTGHLLGASPRVQTYGQLIGSVYSAVLSAAVYRLYMSIYEIPGELFAIPTAYQWIDVSRLVNGAGLPPKVDLVSLVMAILFGLVSIVRTAFASKAAWAAQLPSGLAAAVGMYNTIDFTLARVLGGLLGHWWERRCVRRNEPHLRILMVIVASGFILGEGVLGSTFMIVYSLLIGK